MMRSAKSSPEARDLSHGHAPWADGPRPTLPANKGFGILKMESPYDVLCTQHCLTQDDLADLVVFKRIPPIYSFTEEPVICGELETVRPPF